MRKHRCVFFCWLLHGTRGVCNADHYYVAYIAYIAQLYPQGGGGGGGDVVSPLRSETAVVL